MGTLDLLSPGTACKGSGGSGVRLAWGDTCQPSQSTRGGLVVDHRDAVPLEADHGLGQADGRGAEIDVRAPAEDVPAFSAKCIGDMVAGGVVRNKLPLDPAGEAFEDPETAKR